MKGNRVSATLAPTSQPPVLDRFPATFEALPEPHREVLALVVAHAATHDGAPLPWATLKGYAEVVAASEESGFRLIEVLTGRGLARSLALVVGDLTDYGLLESTLEGLALTSLASTTAETQWNGAFKELVEMAKQLVSS